MRGKCKAIFLFLMYYASFSSEHRKNLCLNYSDYDSINSNNSHCWYSPEVHETPKVIIERHGYVFQSYSVQSPDGFIITLFRIPRKKDGINNYPRQPIFLHHGVATSSLCFFVLQNLSLPFYLVDRGFDVWLTNSRATEYSSTNIYHDIGSFQYWNFSFDEIGVYDLVPQINLISAKTGQKGNIIMLGHSMGTSISYVYAIKRKQHCQEHLKGIISFSPVAFMNHLRGITELLLPFLNIVKKSFYDLRIYGLFTDYEVISQQLISFCITHILICRHMLCLVAGHDTEEISSPAVLLTFLGHNPQPATVKAIHHYGLIHFNQTFREYNNGEEYNFSKIEIPVLLFYGAEDYLSSEQDVKTLYSKLTNSKNKLMKLIPANRNLKFNHMDFLGANHIEELLYKPVMNSIYRFLRP